MLVRRFQLLSPIDDQINRADSRLDSISLGGPSFSPLTPNVVAQGRFES